MANVMTTAESIRDMFGEPCGTGGGCTALFTPMVDGRYWMVTDGNAQAPTRANQKVICGLYNEDGDCLGEIETKFSLVLNGQIKFLFSVY